MTAQPSARELPNGRLFRVHVRQPSRHPGRWEIAFQDNNDVAAQFWRRAATEIAGDDWSLERRAVPGRPELPPDTWISFEVA